jgi:hypothetical protein
LTSELIVSRRSQNRIIGFQPNADEHAMIFREWGRGAAPLKKFCMPLYYMPLYHYTPRLFEDFFPEKSLIYAMMISLPLYPHYVYLYTPTVYASIPPYYYQKNDICSASLSRKLLRALNLALLLQPAAPLCRCSSPWRSDTPQNGEHSGNAPVSELQQ